MRKLTSILVLVAGCGNLQLVGQPRIDNLLRQACAPLNDGQIDVLIDVAEAGIAQNPGVTFEQLVAALIESGEQPDACTLAIFERLLP